ncbi:MAG: hypothetical protein SAMD01599839_14490 [Rectinema sp.]
MKRRERALHIRYWIIGILCSLIFHGLVIFSPLKVTSVREVPPRSLNIGLIRQIALESRLETQQVPRNLKKAEMESPAQKGASQQKPNPESSVNGTTADRKVVPESVAEGGPKEAPQTPHVASVLPAGPASVADVHAAEVEPPAGAQASLPVSAPVTQEPVNMQSLYEESAVLRELGSIAEVPLAGQDSADFSDRMPKDALSEEASNSAPPPVAARAEEAKKEVSPHGTAVPAPVHLEETAKLVETNTPAAIRAPATALASASREYFAPSGDLFVQARNLSGSSPSKVSAADSTSSPRSDSAEAQAALHETVPLQSEQMAELAAERIDAYHTIRYQERAVSGISQVQSPQQNTGPRDPARHELTSQDQSEREVERLAEISPAVPPEENSAPFEIAAPAAQTALRPDAEMMPPPGERPLSDAVSDQSTPAQPPARQYTASSVAHLSLADSNPPHFDTAETLSRRIIAALSAQKEYPVAALKRKTEGTVRLSLDVAPNGSLVMAKIQTRSGSAILDEAALKLVQGIFPLRVRLASAVSLVVPVEYRIPK